MAIRNPLTVLMDWFTGTPVGKKVEDAVCSIPIAVVDWILFFALVGLAIAIIMLLILSGVW